MWILFSWNGHADEQVIDYDQDFGKSIEKNVSKSSQTVYVKHAIKCCKMQSKCRKCNQNAVKYSQIILKNLLQLKCPNTLKAQSKYSQNSIEIQ